MTEFHESQLSSYFELVEKWRDAYKICRLHVLGSRNKNNLDIISARIVLDIGGDTSLKESFTCRDIEAHQVSIGTGHKDIFSVVRLLAAGKAVEIEGIGHLVLPSTEHTGIFVSPPNFLHPEGVNDGNRIAVLSINGAATDTLLVQPDLDWKLKAADTPYDSIQELSIDYGLGPLRGNRALLEVVARTAVQVLAGSNVRGTKGVFGIYLASQLDLRDCKLGLRVLHQAKVVRREIFRSTDLSWKKGDDGLANVGVVEIDIPAGAIVQCIASYAEEAHHIQWRADPSTLLNPRAAVLSQVDPSRSLLRSYLLPELPPRGRAADDFEAAVAWLLWALGFSVASFGVQPKTRDSFDVIATSPRGDFMVVECTLGLLRAESKLSKLAARAVGVRDTFASANMKHLRVLPVIITAMSREQISADLPAASDLEILVITREDLERSINEFLVFPDADALFDQGIQSVQERKSALKLGAAAA